MSRSARRWWARGSLLLVVAAAAALVALGSGHGLGVVLVAAGAVIVTIAAGFWFLAERGTLRWIAFALAVLAPLTAVLVYIAAGLLWVVIVVAALAAAAVWAARQALRPDPSATAPVTVDAIPAQHPWIVMNPKSGGGK